MNKWSKLGLTVGMGTTVALSTHMINKWIISSSTSKDLLSDQTNHKFSWKFGEINYTVKGKGKPVLFIHDLDACSSSYEWSKIIDFLAAKHQVYTIDLLGCGASDKPNITYTAYMYTQLISDFISTIIKKKTSVVVTGKMAPICIMTAFTQPKLFDKMILVNPESLLEAQQIPAKRHNMLRKLLNTPIFGTLLYNINVSRQELKKKLIQKDFYNASCIPHHFLEVYHESAHLKAEQAKFLYASTMCHYTTVSAAHALSQLDQSIYLIYGNKEKGISGTVKEYMNLNPAIEKAAIYNTRHLPQVERPHEFLKYISLFLDD